MTRSAVDDQEIKLRKKLQNKLNQRAHRERIAKQKRGNEKRTPYHVGRWRLAQDSSHTELSDLNHRIKLTNHRLSTQNSRNYESSKWTITNSSPACQPHVMPSPRADFLLSLVQSNVYRGLYDNKLTISQSVDSILPGHNPVAFDVTFPGVFQIIAKTETPNSLALTKLQTDTIHAPWIDLIPFRKMRDVLIQQQGQYDRIALLLDLLGDVPHLETLSSSDSFPSPRGMPENGRYSLDSIYGDNENGLPLWIYYMGRSIRRTKLGNNSRIYKKVALAYEGFGVFIAVN